VRERRLKPQNMYYVYIFSCREVGAVASQLPPCARSRSSGLSVGQYPDISHILY